MVYVNHNNKAIYIHIPKCGGCYIRDVLKNKYGFHEITINKHCNYDEFIDNTKNILLENEKNEKNEYYKHSINKMGKYRFFYSHQDINKDIFDNYFKFTFVRNPYTKIISAYLYLKRVLYESKDENVIKTFPENKDYFVNFKTFIQNYDKINIVSYCHAFITQYEQLVDFSNNICFNYIGKQENLDTDLLNILTILNITNISHEDYLHFNIRHNVSNNEFNDIYEYYDETIFLFINKHFEKDFEVFNYKKFDTFEEFTNIYRHYEQIQSSLYVNTERFLEIPKFIKSNQRNYNNKLIPNNIIQTFKTNIIHTSIYNNIIKILDINKNYDYFFYTDDDAIKLIKENFDQRTIDAFEMIKIGAAKGDFIRYICLYLFGGVYLDLDAGINIDLDNFIPRDKEFIFFYAGYKEHDQQYSIIQWIIIIKPYHDIMKKVIEEMVNRIHNNESKIYLATGPKLFTDVIYNLINETEIYNVDEKFSKRHKKEFIIDKGKQKYEKGSFINITECDFFKFNFSGYNNNMLYYDDSKYTWASNIYNNETLLDKRRLLGITDFDTSVLYKEILTLSYSDNLQKKNINKYYEIINCLFEELTNTTNNHFVKKNILKLKENVDTLNMDCNNIFNYNNSKLIYIKQNLIKTYKKDLKKNICYYCDFNCFNDTAYNSHKCRSFK